MNAQEVIDAIHGSYSSGSKNGLRNMTALLETISRQNSFKETMPDRKKCCIIHVAGTNGKGSICAMLESILRSAGYSTGMYTSPFLQHYQERIRFDGEPIDDGRLVKYGTEVIEAAEEMRLSGNQPTPFELGTALAYDAFAGENVDAAIIEVGLGGRLDPTNIITPSVSAIAAIGMDHMQFLGSTLEEIAGEKAGIIKEKVPCVCQCAEENVAQVFSGKAEEMNAPIFQLHKDQLLEHDVGADGSMASFDLENRWNHMEISLPGKHQLMNAMTALKVVEVLRSQGMNIPEAAVREGLSRTVWPGRLEWCGNILIDGGHNAQGINALLDFVEEHLAGKKRVLFSGVLSEKLHEEMLGSLGKLADAAVTVTPDTPRAMDAEEYAEQLSKTGMKAHAATNVREGLAKAREMAGDDGIIIASGSLYFVGELRNVLNLPWKKN